MKPRLITPPGLAVTVEEFRDNSRIPAEETDAALSRMIRAAGASAEAYCDRAFGAQTWELRLDTFPRWIDLTPVPLVSVASITYRDANDVEQAIAPAAYSTGYLTRGDAYLYPMGNWPTASGGIVVRYVVGAGWPDDIQQAVLLIAGHWYNNRETASTEPMREIPMGATWILDRHRRMFA